MTPNFILSQYPISRSISYTCPFCNRGGLTTYVTHRTPFESVTNERKILEVAVVECPNPGCHEFAIRAKLLRQKKSRSDRTQHEPTETGESWVLRPRSTAKQVPNYVPEAIRRDYEEACLIRDLSPKASATLSRRCLQGMIRDFHDVKKGRLIDEINAIKEKVDPITWDAIDGLRTIGNIGAHMEKDVNLLIDVEANEAQLLISLNEYLFKEWYIHRQERTQMMKAISTAAQTKKEAKNGGLKQSPSA